MKKVLLCILGLIISITLVGCGTKEGEKESKDLAKKIYEKANDTTITKCVARYKIESKSVIYGFCINEATDLYFVVSPDTEVRSVSKEILGYNSMYTIYSTVEKEVTNSIDGFTSFEFKPSELK